MRILVVYGSKRGGTAGLAEMVRGAFESEGFEADVRDAGERIANLADYDAAVIGGALYANRWHRDARGFVRRHRRSLSAKPTWLFSSGPLDDSAETKAIPPVKQVAKRAAAVGARGHETFGGRLDADVQGFPASAVAKAHSGDWRDDAHVQRWVHDIAAELRDHLVAG